MIAVMQTGVACLNEVDFLFAIVGQTLTSSVRIKRNFSKTRHAPKATTVGVALAENRLVMASLGDKSGFRIAQAWNVAVQPCWVDLPFLREQSGRQKQQQCKVDAQTFSRARAILFSCLKVYITHNRLT